MMLVLSRHRDETIDVFPGPEFPAALAAFLQRCGVVEETISPATLLKTIKTAIADDPLFQLAFTVVDIRGDKARLGCEAHNAFAVHRREVAVEVKARERSTAKAG